HRFGFARCHQAPAQTHQRGQLGPAHLVPQKIQQNVFTDPRAPAGQHRLEESLVVSLVERTGLWVPKGAGDPIGHRRLAYLDVEIADLLNQKPPLQGALIEIEKLPARFVFFGPPSGLDAELQPSLGLRLLELLRGDLPAVDGPVVGPAAAENTAPASATTGGRVEENNKRDDGEGGDDR